MDGASSISCAASRENGGGRPIEQFPVPNLPGGTATNGTATGAVARFAGGDSRLSLAKHINGTEGIWHMKAHEALRAAHSIISAHGWTQDANAVNADGHPVPVFISRTPNPAAARYSIYGALVRAGLEGSMQTETGLMWDVLRRKALEAGARGNGAQDYLHPLVAFNDREGQTQEAVLAFLLDCAMECESQSKELATLTAGRAS
jgi:hypothetical protein